MLIRPPCKITSRLMAGIRINDATISIERMDETTRDNRDRFHYFIDGPDFEYENTDLSSGVGGCSLQAALESLLSFLSAAGETYAYQLRSELETEDDLFPNYVREWCSSNQDELSTAGIDLEETPNLIEE